MSGRSINPKECTVTKTESESVPKNGKGSVGPEGIVQGLVEGVGGLTTIARDQANESFRQGERAAMVLRDQSLVSIRAAEAIGLAVLHTLADIVLPLSPRLPVVAPAGRLETVVKAGFDVAQQLLATERKLAETAVDQLTSLAA
jgi:hypothetical protein